MAEPAHPRRIPDGWCRVSETLPDLYSARIVNGAVELVLPLPPSVLGHHGGGWQKMGYRRSTGKPYVISGNRKAFATVRDEAITALRQVSIGHGLQWPAAVMSVEWRFAGTAPDSDGIWTRVSAIRDAAQHVQIVTNDRYITQGTLTLVRVKKVDQRVVLRFARAEQQEAA